MSSNQETKIEVDPLIPLDGKTSLESPELQQLTSNLHHEIKSAIEKNYQTQWSKQRQEIFRTIAILLKPNYPRKSSHNLEHQEQNKLPSKDTSDLKIGIDNFKSCNQDEEAYLFGIIEKIQERLHTKIPSKKGRPKKKKNPWQHILLDDMDNSTGDSIEFC